MGKISLSNIAEELAIKSGLTREASDSFVHSFVKTIEKGLQEDGMVKIKGLGTFKLQEMSDRGSVDVNTGERITIKGYHKVTFTPDITLKELVNRPFAHFEPTELNDGYPDEEDGPGSDADNVSDINAPDETCGLDEPSSPVNVNEPCDSSGSAGLMEKENTMTENLADKIPTSEVITQKTVYRRRGCLWGFLCLSLVVSVAALTFLYFIPSSETSSTSHSDTPLLQSEIKVNPNLGEELGTEWNYEQYEETKGDTVAVPMEESFDSLGKRLDSVAIPIMVDTNSYTVKIIESLQARSIKDITSADTTDYVIKGTLNIHSLKRGETIVQLANTYYGDKRLWPYIVKYNKIVHFNSVAIGQEILIPLLEEK